MSWNTKWIWTILIWDVIWTLASETEKSSALVNFPRSLISCWPQLCCVILEDFYLSIILRNIRWGKIIIRVDLISVLMIIFSPVNGVHTFSNQSLKSLNFPFESIFKTLGLSWSTLLLILNGCKRIWYQQLFYTLKSGFTNVFLFKIHILWSHDHYYFVKYKVKGGFMEKEDGTK